jgi:hypothetical protein
VREKLPSQKSSFLPGNGARKLAATWWWRQKISWWQPVDVEADCPCAWWWPARWEPQEEGMMNIVASFPSVKKPRFNIGQERRDGDDWRWYNWLNNTPTRAPLTILVDSSSASSNAEPAHTQTNTLLLTCDEVVNLTGLLKTKVMSVSSGKQ